MAKLYDAEGSEVEAFTTEERDAYTKTEVEKGVGATKTEFEKQIGDLTQQNKDMSTVMDEQKVNFTKVRERDKETVAKMTQLERELYESNISRQKYDEERAVSEKARWANEVEKEVKAKAMGNVDLEKKIRDNLAFVSIEPTTIEQVQAKVALARGGVFEQSPDMLASIGGFTGGVYPNTPAVEKKSYADTSEGQAQMKAMGMITDEQIKNAKK